jgi:hypothetical protein
VCKRVIVNVGKRETDGSDIKQLQTRGPGVCPMVMSLGLRHLGKAGRATSGKSVVSIGFQMQLKRRVLGPARGRSVDGQQRFKERIMQKRKDAEEYSHDQPGRSKPL